MNSGNKNTITSNVANAFDNIIKIYSETALLLKDFSAELSNMGFSIYPHGKENAIETNHSKSLNSSLNWLITQCTRCFVPENSNHSKRHIAITVIFHMEKHPNTEPQVIVSVMESDKHYSWLYCAYCNTDGVNRNIENKFKYSYRRKKFNHFPGSKESNNKMIEFIYTKDEQHRGSFIAMPLLQIDSVEKVKKLANQMVEYWKERDGKAI